MAGNELTVDQPAVAGPTFEGLLGSVNVTALEGYAGLAGLKYLKHLDGFNTDIPTAGDKDFQIGEDVTVSAAPFTLYRGVEDSMFQANGMARVRDAYDRAEAHGVDGKIQDLVLNPVAVDITPVPGTGVKNVRYALGLLEQYAADNTTVRPMISTNAIGGELISDELKGDPGSLTTKLGTNVVIAPGYRPVGPGDTAAPAGTAWLYITGQINIWKGTPAESESKSLVLNRAEHLTETTYVSSVDSLVAAILIAI